MILAILRRLGQVLLLHNDALGVLLLRILLRILLLHVLLLGVLLLVMVLLLNAAALLGKQPLGEVGALLQPESEMLLVRHRDIQRWQTDWRLRGAKLGLRSLVPCHFLAVALREPLVLGRGCGPSARRGLAGGTLAAPDGRARAALGGLQENPLLPAAFLPRLVGVVRQAVLAPGRAHLHGCVAHCTSSSKHRQFVSTLPLRQSQQNVGGAKKQGVFYASTRHGG